MTIVEQLLSMLAEKSVTQRAIPPQKQLFQQTTYKVDRYALTYDKKARKLHGREGKKLHYNSD